MNLLATGSTCPDLADASPSICIGYTFGASLFLLTTGRRSCRPLKKSAYRVKTPYYVVAKSSYRAHKAAQGGQSSSWNVNRTGGPSGADSYNCIEPPAESS